MARWLWVRCPPVRVRQGPLSSQAGGHRVHDGLSAHGYRVSRSAAAVAAAIAAATLAAAAVATTAVAPNELLQPLRARKQLHML